MQFDVTPPAALPTRSGDFQVVAFRFHAAQAVEGGEHLAVIKGEISGAAVLTRIHSSCLTGDVLGSCRCDCGPQLSAALEAIEKEGRGVLLYLNQEGRGIGLFNKIRAYVEQDLGANTVEANVKLGFDADGRSYDQAVAMLRHLGVQSVRLLTNNPAKVEAVRKAGIAIAERVPHSAGMNDANRLYIQTKRDLLGHIIG